MLIPYSTDAPIYHWPIATVGLIVVNVVVFVGVMTGNLGEIDEWMLIYGDGLHPLQWISSIFVHAGIMHLLGNMLFLWVFGLIVEGKLGWWRFLICYLAIGVGQSMGEQIAMLGYAGETPGSLGASAAIFGLMAMASVWAPLNDISCLLLVYGVTELEVPIWGFSAVYTGLEWFALIRSGGEEGSSWLHLAGFFLGIPLAIGLFKLKAVDCEGWDIFNVARGTYGSRKIEPSVAEINAKVESRKKQRDEGQRSTAHAQFKFLVANGNVEAAIRLFDKTKTIGGGLKLDRAELLTVIKWLHGQKRWRESAPFMAELIGRFPEQADPVRVKLAQICLVELSRPGKALDLLSDVDKSKLPEQQQALVKKMTVKAQQLQAEGTVELDVETW